MPGSNEVLKNKTDIMGHATGTQSQLEQAPTGHIWDNLNTK